jgi:uncharacterized membrane protein
MLEKKSGNIKENLLLKLGPPAKMVICTCLSALAWFILRKCDFEFRVASLIIWIVFACTYLLMSWLVFVTCSKEQMRVHAGREDGSRTFVSLLLMVSSFAGMLTVLVLIVAGDTAGISQPSFLAIIIASMFLSWAMVHTTYTFHYAHLYYDDKEGEPEQHAAGLDFPGEQEPDYLDFAYFSFVIGMTFQVSDVQVTSHHVRKQTLVHALLSFGLNTVVVALAINLIAGLKK